MYSLDDLNNYGVIEDETIDEDAWIVEEESDIGIN